MKHTFNLVGRYISGLHCYTNTLSHRELAFLGSEGCGRRPGEALSCFRGLNGKVENRRSRAPSTWDQEKDLFHISGQDKQRSVL